MTRRDAAPARRLSYVDWMRGLAILIMIEAHVIDAWTRPADRRSLAFGCAAILAGFAAPMFLFLAGVSASLGAAARARKLGAPAAAASVRRRGWQIFGLAYLFRLQAYMLNPRAMLAGVLKVDILNIMGPSIVAVAGLWQAGRSYGRRLAFLGGAALAITLVTPLIRTSMFVQAIPDVLEWYLRPVAARNNFTFFPWMGFVFAGGAVGVLLDRPRLPGDERRFQAWLGGGALLFAAACYGGSYLPSIYADSQFWTSAPSFFLLRVGLVTAVLSVAYFWEQRRRLLPYLASHLEVALFTGGGRLRELGVQDMTPGWSPMARFGRASLFVYWVHVELVYGIFSQPLHRNLSFESCLLAFAGFSLLMFAIAMLKNRVIEQWREWRRTRREVLEPAAR